MMFLSLSCLFFYCRVGALQDSAPDNDGVRHQGGAASDRQNPGATHHGMRGVSGTG